MPHDAGAHQSWPLGDSIYRQFLDGSVDEMYLHDDQGVILDVNQAVCNAMRVSRAQLIGRYVYEISSQHSQQELAQLWHNHPVGANAVANDIRRRVDGTSYHVEVHITCQLHEGRKYFFALCRNIDEKIKREQEIYQLNQQLELVLNERTRQWQESSQLLEIVLEQTPDVVFVKDTQGRYQYANHAMLQNSNATLEQVLGHTDFDIFPPDIAQAHLLGDQQAMASTGPIVYEKVQPYQGRTRTFSAMKTPLRDSNGQVQGVLGMLRDITDNQLVLQRMAHDYEMLRQAELVTRVGSWTLDLSTNTFTASEMLRQLNGLGPEDPPLTPESLSAMMPAEEHALLSAAIGRCLQDGSPYSLDVQHRHPAGGWFPCRIRGQAYRNAQGSIVMLHGTVQDLSEYVDAQNRLQSLADNLPNGAIFRAVQTDKGHVVPVYLSASIQDILGLVANQFIQEPQSFLNGIHPDDIAPYLQAVSDSVQTQQNFDVACRMRHSSGHWRWIRVRATRRDWLDKVYWEGLILDITAEQEAQQALQRAKEAAESAERAKSEFLATMSHEIRTPMNTVLGMTQLLQQTPMAPKQRNYVDKVSRSASALLAIINDILDYSKLEAEMLLLAPAPFRLDELLETVSNLTSLRAEQKGLEVIYALADDVPRMLEGDMQRLVQILTNLLGNAIKFTEQGEVVVRIQLSGDAPAPQWHNTDAAPVTLLVSVQDTGIGILPEHMERLFHPFTQAEAHISRRFGGTGLGLTISRKLVQMMGGDIQVRSQPGVGSIFSFTAQLIALPHSRPAQRTSLHTNCRVLAVDDSATARETLAAMLDSWGLHCDSADSGAQALHMLSTANEQGQPYHLVLMDWRMPEMDGLQVAEHIRGDQQLAHIPAILMVTAYCRDEVLTRVEALGLQGLLIKPVTASSLFNAMQDALAGNNALPLDMAPAPQTENLLHMPAELHGRRILVVDDNALNREVAQDLLELAHIHVTCASSGYEALDLLAQHSFDAVLLDIQMPELDGMAVARRIRQRLGLRLLPVIALTAQARDEDRQAILASGMNGHLSKPIEAQHLYNSLLQHLQHLPPVFPPATSAFGRAAPTPPSIAPPAAQAPSALPVFGANASAERTNRLLRAFLRDFGNAPEQIQQLYEQQDWAALGLLAHTLKGSIGYLKLPQAVQAMADLEHHCQHSPQDTNSPPLHSPCPLALWKLPCKPCMTCCAMCTAAPQHPILSPSPHPRLPLHTLRSLLPQALQAPRPCSLWCSCSSTSPKRCHCCAKATTAASICSNTSRRPCAAIPCTRTRPRHCSWLKTWKPTAPAPCCKPCSRPWALCGLNPIKHGPAACQTFLLFCHDTSAPQPHTTGTASGHCADRGRRAFESHRRG